ncbi:hypothetical protein ROZALSC1DRAFT_29678 [Rozella allomycis CSF55]|uniref:Serine/threonine-protein kinase domain-containing protein 1 n=1 Tax=Rozella allomycis (strain CSF55) TaxID=988480 RepID=A0A075AMY8_ROZAC|nr:Serine/threonine-protein kinase domain-containing protein 1 [Rozella allomycis CSF55]RKP18656.1 hypothetical protein ROZALSC1DRAFT_29678 [Rozella allomycis CSF55]|eukprot:EPZ31119.1 Serine/threonine-protein kinase domain-containing protein 1 [Rozella allomycis CSF55]
MNSVLEDLRNRVVRIKQLLDKPYKKWSVSEKEVYVNRKQALETLISEEAKLNSEEAKLNEELDRERERENKKLSDGRMFLNYLVETDMYTISQRKLMLKIFAENYETNLILQMQSWELILLEILEIQEKIDDAHFSSMRSLPCDYISKWTKIYKSIEKKLPDLPNYLEAPARRFYNLIGFGIVDSSFVINNKDLILEILEEQNLGLSVKIPFESMEMTGVNEFSDEEKNAFNVALMKAKIFEHSKSANPEEQYRILHSFILEAGITWINSHLKFVPEYQMNSLTGYKFDHKIDIAFVLKGFGPFDLPFFLVECSGYFTNGFQHKDYRKLIMCMFSVLLYLKELFKNYPEVQKKLRVYGGFTGKSILQLVKLVPVIDGKDSFYIFENPKDWELDVLGNEKVSCEKHECTFCKNRDFHELELKDVEIEFGNLCITDDTKINKVPVYDESICTNNLSHLFNGLKEVREYGEYLRKEISKLDVPFIENFSFQSFSSESNPNTRPSHSKSTSRKDRQRRTPKKSNMTTRNNQGSSQTTAVITKYYNSSEIEFLKKLQSDKVVQLFDYTIYDDHYELVEELLYLKNSIYYNEEDLLDYVCNGLEALLFLRDNFCIHRDIKPANYMYSYNSNTWKLLDFDRSIFVDESGVVAFNKVHGTEGFIAPEMLNCENYSYTVDWFSFGKTLEKIPLQRFDKSFASFVNNIITSLTNTSPSHRQDPALLLSQAEKYRPLEML